MASGTEIETAVSSRGMTPQMTPQMSFLAGAVAMWNGRPSLPHRLMPSETERASIESKIATLEAELSPASGDQIIEAVRALFLASPQQAVSKEVMQGRYRIFIAALSDQPAWAIEAAAVKWFKGQTGGSVTFAPSSGELRRLSEAETLPHRTMIERLKRILIARPAGEQIDPDERKRVARKLSELAKSMTEEKRA